MPQSVNVPAAKPGNLSLTRTHVVDRREAHVLLNSHLCQTPVYPSQYTGVNTC